MNLGLESSSLIESEPLIESQKPERFLSAKAMTALNTLVTSSG